MMRSYQTALMVGVIASSTAAWAQEIVTTPLDEVPLDELIGELIITPNEPLVEDYLSTPREAVMQEVTAGTGGELRVLDKLTGAVTDLSLGQGQTATLGFLAVTLKECRYPVENPSGDAFAAISVIETRANTPLFSGWMLASAPALNAMDHPRYDVWALRCITS